MGFFGWYSGNGIFPDDIRETLVYACWKCHVTRFLSSVLGFLVLCSSVVRIILTIAMWNSSMFISGSIHQGHERFSDISAISRGRQFLCLVLVESMASRVFLVFFCEQPETAFEQCSFDFRIIRRHDVDGNFLLGSLHVLTLRVCSKRRREGFYV